MSNIKISQLTSASPLTGAELVPVVQSGGTVRTDTNTLKLYVLTSIQPEVSALQQSLVSVNVVVSALQTLPINGQSGAYIPTALDNGKVISITAGGVTVPAGVFLPSQAFTVYNDSANAQTISQGSGVTLRWAGTAGTGSRSISGYGLVTVLCVSNDVFVASGAGLY